MLWTIADRYDLDEADIYDFDNEVDEQRYSCYLGEPLTWDEYEEEQNQHRKDDAFYQSVNTWEAWEDRDQEFWYRGGFCTSYHSWDDDFAQYVEDNPRPLRTAVDTVSDRLTVMPWLHSAKPQRRRRRFTRRAGRYRLRQDHGTAAARQGIEQSRQHHANRHEVGYLWRVARRMKASRNQYQADLSTWGDYEADCIDRSQLSDDELDMLQNYLLGKDAVEYDDPDYEENHCDHGDFRSPSPLGPLGYDAPYGLFDDDDDSFIDPWYDEYGYRSSMNW